MRLPFGPYEPDKPPFLSTGLQQAVNVYQGAIGYRPVGQFQSASAPLTSAPLGAASFVSGLVMCGTASNLYRLDGTSWTSLESGYSATKWRFVQFGSIAIATNGTDPIQKINLTSYATADLAGPPPRAELITVVKDFVLCGVVGGVRNKVQWSAINNAEGWTVGLDQCDYQILPTGGDVTGLLGGEYGIILQRGRVSRMTYVGNNLVFQFDELSNNVGCRSANSVVQAGSIGAWLSDTGFQMWDGATIRPIGHERVDRTFASLYAQADLANMSTAVDLKNTLFVWTMPERSFLYNWTLDRWSVIEQPATLAFSGDTGGDPKFYVFDDTYTLGTFSGGPMEARMQTGSVELVPGRDARISMVRPLTDAEYGITVSFTPQSRLSDMPEQRDYTEIGPNGDMAVRESGRYFRVTMTLAPEADWTYAMGLDLTAHKGAVH